MILRRIASRGGGLLASLIVLFSVAGVSAQAVIVDVVRDNGVPELDANGNWGWEIRYDATGSGAIGVEFGAEFFDADVISGSVVTTGLGNGDVEVANPGQKVFGWESASSGTGGAFPVGLQVDPSEGTNGQAFYAFGTGPVSSPTNLLLATFTTEGPSLASPTSQIDLRGAYDAFGNILATGSGTHGVVFTSTSLFAFNSSDSITAKAGDVDLDGFVGPDDTSILQSNFGSSAPRGWANGDLDGNNFVDFEDVFAYSPTYEALPLSATTPGSNNDGQVSFRYNPLTGDVALFPDGNDIGLIRLSSQSGIFTTAAALPPGSFTTSNDSLVGVVVDDGNGQAFSGEGISLGSILPTGLDETFLLQDLELNWSGGFGTPNADADLVIASPGPGDFDGDGMVANGDLNLLLLNWGAATFPGITGWDGDLPTGLEIDNDELNRLLLNWGDGDSSSIPEPATLVVSLAAIALLRRR